MTVPCERTRSLIYSWEFLLDLLDPKKTPKVPRVLRERAGKCLRHFPLPYELAIICNNDKTGLLDKIEVDREDF